MFWRHKPSGLSYEEIFKKLSCNKVRYMLIGGIAVNLYGIQRATGDIDLMLDMDKDNILSFAKIMNELGLTPKVPVKAEDLADPVKVKSWKEEKNMLVFSFIDLRNPYIEIDVMTENYINFEEAYQRRTVKTAFGIELSLVSIEDLIRLKEIAGRDLDKSDVEALKKFNRL